MKFFKKGVCLLLIALLVIQMTACSHNAGKAETSGTPNAGTNDTGTGGQTTSGTLEVGEWVDLLNEGESGFSLIRSSKANSVVSALCVSLGQEIGNKTGKTPVMSDDWIKGETEVSNNVPEILIGNTNRVQSKEALKGLGTGQFCIRMMGSKLVIAGSSDRMLQIAVHTFITEYLNGSRGEAGDRYFRIPKDLNDTSEMYSSRPSDIMRIAKKISGSMTYCMNLGKQDGFGVMQGSCTDGTYGYFFMNDGNNGSAESVSRLYKVDMSTFSVVASGDMLVCHPNDATYNKKKNQIIVTNYSPRGNELSIVDPDTLTVTGKVVLGFQADCIAYNAENDTYVIGQLGTRNFYVTDSKFKTIRLCDNKSAVWGQQGMECDTDYVYFLQWDKETNRNYLVTYTWMGNFVANIELKGISKEGENVFWLGGRFFIGYYVPGQGGTVYETELLIDQFR